MTVWPATVAPDFPGASPPSMRLPIGERQVGCIA